MTAEGSAVVNGERVEADVASRQRRLALPLPDSTTSEGMLDG